MRIKRFVLVVVIGILCQCTALPPGSTAANQCSPFEPLILPFQHLLAMRCQDGQPFAPDQPETVALFLSNQICMDCLTLCLEFIETWPSTPEMDLVAILQPGMLEGRLLAQYRLKRLPRKIVIDWDSHFESLPITFAVIDWETNQIRKSYQPEKQHPVPACLESFLTNQPKERGE